MGGSKSTPPRRPTSNQFTANVTAQAYNRQNGLCAMCGESFLNVVYYAHHIRRHADGGSGSLDNCALLCEECHYHVHNHGNYRQSIEIDRRDLPYLNE